MRQAGVISEQYDPLKSEGLLITWPPSGHKTAAGQRQVVIKSAVIPSVNSSWAGSQGEKAKDGQIEEERQQEWGSSEEVGERVAGGESEGGV